MSLQPADDRVGPAESGSWTAADRGQSVTLGLVLVFGLIIIGSFIVIVLGATAIGDAEKGLSDERAGKALTQFDSKAGLVALGEADSQRVSFPIDDDGKLSIEDNAGWMNITVENRTTGDTFTVMNTTLGAVVYQDGDTRMGYQGGGVWRGTDTGGRMISPPEFHYRNGTLTLPTVTLTGDTRLSGDVTVTQDGETQTFPDESKNDDEWINPLDDHKVNLTVGSQFYDGWGHYFEERTDGDVIYDENDETVTLELVVPADNPPVEGGLVTGANQELVVKNNAQMDSYDSEAGTYSETSDSSTKIFGSGDLSIEQNSKVWGNVEVDGDVTFENNAELEDGNISYGGTIGGKGWPDGWTHDSHHWHNDNGSVRSSDAVDLLIQERIAEIRGDNDNGATGDVSSGDLNCGSSCTLTAGEYYFDGLSVGGDLELDTSSGNIELAVDGNLDVSDNVEVVGDGRVNVWVRDDAYFDNGVEVIEADDNSTKFWLYMKPDRGATLGNNAQFRGVIYGPGNVEPGVDVTLKQNVDVFGGVIGDVDFAANNVWVHYDEALADTESVTYETSIITITYLHVSENRIKIRDA